MSETNDEAPAPTSSKLTVMLKSAVTCALVYSAVSTLNSPEAPRRRLSMVGDSVPSYVDSLMKDLRDRKKLFEDTPPEEVKYWFEYAGPLQVSVDDNSKLWPAHDRVVSLTR